ncbi:MAG: recombinase family protein, partial [Oscillibacter sp.]|nr:recombinase family protein [Oscillibacter sp.]
MDTFRDEGRSGAKTDKDEEKIERDGLLDLLDRINEEDIQYIVVLSTNRLWRSDMVKMIIHRELKRYKVDIRSID